MPNIKYIKKKIDQSYLVWFQNSNSFTQLEEPAWFVFSKIVKRYKSETIAKMCAIRYEIEHDECLKFVSDIRTNVELMNLDVPAEELYQTPEELDRREVKTYSEKKYQFTDKLIVIRVEDRKFESFLHPLINHWETNANSNNYSLFELFNHDDKIAFRLNGELKGLWKTNDTHRLIGFLYICLINEMYGKSNDFWLMTVHAAGVTNGRKTILIPAESGSGKTTLAAMLQSKGFQLVSDDFIPIDKHSFCAWPFPVAMSIKPGAQDVLTSTYPELTRQQTTVSNAKKQVKYLKPNIDSLISREAFPVKEVVTVKYNPDINFDFKKASRLKSIRLMLDQSWILPNSENARLFLDLATRWSFYELTYSDNEKALNAITKLFEND